MISSRRLAREWALKILYQMDVGKVSPEEGLGSALERLRREFVLRGSRRASGSLAEEICLEAITREIEPVLPAMRPVLERAILAVVGSALHDAAYWQEVRMETAFKRAAPGLPLEPPRLLMPVASSEMLTALREVRGNPPISLTDSLNETEQAWVSRLMTWAQSDLPRLLDPEIRKEARRFARELAENRPVAGGPTAVQDYLLRRRREYNTEATARWNKVGQVMVKQTSDWIHVAAFAYKLVMGVHRHQVEVDKSLAALSTGWTLDRQVAVDRNILRMAAYETLFLAGIPTSATINEAVELAKKYSTAESSRFVNGVLGALAAQQSLKPETPEWEETDVPDDAVDMDEIADREELEQV